MDWHPPRIELLTGIAGTGKTTRLLELYARELQEARKRLQPGSTLWLTPTNRSRNELRRRLLSGSQGVSRILFEPGVVTFDDFAERVLRAAPQGISPLSPAMRRTLLRRVIRNLRDANRLPYFAEISPTAGFLDLVSRFITELKRDEIWPEDFVRILAGHRAVPRDSELALIYQQYQATLLRENVYDGEGRFWSARQALAQGEWGPFANLSLVVIDGFTDFTQTQFEILSLLSRHAARCVLSLPAEEWGGRADLFAKTGEVRARLEESCELRPGEALPGPPTPSESWLPLAIRQISEWLFANPLEIQRAETADGLEILEVAGQVGEVRLLAYRVKQLLQSKVPAGDIVVAVRGLDDYADLLEEIFTESGIPFSSEAGMRLAQAPLLKALLNLLRAEAENWPFQRVLAFLNSAYFQPPWRNLAGKRGAWGIAVLLRRYRLDSNRKQILEVLNRELQQYETLAATAGESSSVAKEVELHRIALRLLRKLSSVTERLRGAHSREEWAEVLAALARDLGWPPVSVATDAAREAMWARWAAADSRAWDIFRRTLFDAARAEKLAETETVKLTLTELLPELTDLLKTTACSSGVPEEGRVRILEAQQVRNLSVPYLFLAGLTERSFPQHRGDDCLYHEVDRRQLNDQASGAGTRLKLGHRVSRAQEEMLLFYGIVTRARKRLVLSYPAVSATGAPLAPSPYVRAIEELFAAGSIARTQEPVLDPLPRGERLLSNGDVRLHGMQAALLRAPGLLRKWCDAPENQPVAANLFSAVDLAAWRFHTPHFTRAEGMLENPHNRELLRTRFSQEHEFSASQLETYAVCPFRFWLSQVLKIEPLGSVEVATDHAQRGSLVHEVLAELYRQFFLTSPEARTSGMPSAEELAEAFQARLEGRLGRMPSRTQLQAALQRVEGRLLAECGPPLGEQQARYAAGFTEAGANVPMPRHLEMSFGTPYPGVETAGTVQHACLVLGSGENTVKVAGRIDRVDVGRLPDGEEIFVVVDYKTGSKKAHSREEIGAGRELQLALYALAVQQLGIVGPQARPYQFGYWKIREEGFLPAMKPGRGARTAGIPALDAAVWEELERMLRDIVPQLAAGIRAGEFPVDNPDQKCTGHCAYGMVCRVTQIRSLPASLAKRRGE